MVDFIGRDGHKVSIAKPASLTDWDNGHVKAAVGELVAIDDLLFADFTPLKAVETEVPTPGDYENVILEGYDKGQYNGTHRLQTGILTSWVMGAEAVAGGPTYTHTITKKATRTPPNLLLHLEKEGTNLNYRKDAMGHIPMSIDIYCSEKTPQATQIITTFFAFDIDGDDLAAPAYLSTTTYAPYQWYHYKATAGASSFLYNTAAIALDIQEIHMHISWRDVLFGTQEGHYHTNGLWVPPFSDSFVEIGGKPIDSADVSIQTLVDLLYSSYAGVKLIFIADFYESATRHLSYTWDKMRIDRESWKQVFRNGNTQWYDGYQFKMKFGESASSLVCEDMNAISGDSYP